jgi:Lsr2
MPTLAAGRPRPFRQQIVGTRVAADTGTVEQWARANGYQVCGRGRIPNAVMAAFDADQVHSGHGTDASHDSQSDTL